MLIKIERIVIRNAVGNVRKLENGLSQRAVKKVEYQWVESAARSANSG